MFFSAYRRAVRERRKIEADRDFWKQRALTLESKYEARTDFYIEREFKLVDRILTKNNTFAITDEIRAQRHRRTDDDRVAYEAALERFLEEKRQDLIAYATEAGLANPSQEAERTLTEQRSLYIADFDRDYHYLNTDLTISS